MLKNKTRDSKMPSKYKRHDTVKWKRKKLILCFASNYLLKLKNTKDKVYKEHQLLTHFHIYNISFIN